MEQGNYSIVSTPSDSQVYDGFGIAIALPASLSVGFCVIGQMGLDKNGKPFNSSFSFSLSLCLLCPGSGSSVFTAYGKPIGDSVRAEVDPT